MYKYLITGSSGFIARHFINYLEERKIKAFVLGIDVVPHNIDKKYEYVRFTFKEDDLMNTNKIQYILYEFKPDYILHLASYSSVAFSWQNPVISFQNNINIFLNLLEAVNSIKLRCRMLSIGSSEEYGDVTEDKLPLKENYPLDPVSPYAVARVCQEMLSKVYINGYNQDIILTRSFNHLGPGQGENFVIPSFAKQLIEMKNYNIKNPNLIVGDLSIVRDFLDVRDAVEAYFLLLKYGKKAEVYNVCSGKGFSLKEVVNTMTRILNITIDYTVNKDLIRPKDNKMIIGSNDKIREQIGWIPKIPFSKTLEDILKEWDDRLDGR